MPESTELKASDRQEIRSACFHRDFNSSGCLDAHLGYLMLSQLLTTSVLLPKMDSMILIAHMTLSWPPSSPR